MLNNAPFITGFVAILGLLIGSFLNVCIYRIPVQEDLFDDEIFPELVKLRDQYASEKKIFSVSIPPRSFCPRCHHELKWYHNIPVFSWLFLKGRCAFCNTAISVRYPFIELLSAITAVLSLNIFDFSLAAIVSYLICAAFIVITFIDYDHFMIPDIITFRYVALGVVIIGLNQFYSFLPAPFSADLFESLYGVLAGSGSLFVIAKTYLWLRKREGLGLGDVKLLLVTGVFFGYQGAFFTIFIGSLVGSILGIFFMIIRRRSFAQEIPFGPYLCFANFLYMIAMSEKGQLLLSAYLNPSLY